MSVYLHILSGGDGSRLSWTGSVLAAQKWRNITVKCSFLQVYCSLICNTTCDILLFLMCLPAAPAPKPGCEILAFKKCLILRMWWKGCQQLLFHIKCMLHPSFFGCGGLTLAGCQVPTKAALSLHSSAGQGRENITKGSWVEIRTGRDHSLITVMGKTDSTWGN